MPDKKYFIDIPGMPEGSGIWDADKWERNKDAFMRDYPEANVFELGEYDPEDSKDTDQIMLSFEDEASSGIWDSAKWERNKDSFMKDYPEANVSRVRHVDYWADAAEQNRIRRAELDQPDAEREARLAEIGYYDDISGENKSLTINDPMLKPVSAAMKQNSVSGEVEYLDPKVAEFYANDNAYTERLAERARLDAEYEENPRVKEMRAYEEQQARYATDLENEIKEDMSSEVDAVQAGKGAFYKTAAGPGVGDAAIIQQARDFLKGEDASRAYVENEKQERYATSLKLLQKSKIARNLAGKGFGGAVVDWTKEGVMDAGTQSDIEAYNEIGDILTRLEREVGNLKPENINEDVFEQYLSKDEQALIKSFFEYNSAMADAQQDMSRAYKGGKIFAESIPFMLEFLVTGGLYQSSGRAATRGLERALVNWVSKSARNTAARTAKKVVSAATRDALFALTGTAARTVASPGTYSRMAEASLEINEEGHVDRAKNAAIAAADMYVENLSEISGGLIGKGFGAIGKGASKLIAKTPLSKIGSLIADNRLMQGISKFLPKLEALGFHGLPEEIGEEFIGNTIREITGIQPGALNEMVSDDNFGAMLIGFAPMTLLGAAGGAVSIGVTNIEAANLGKDLRESLSDHYSAEQIDHMMSSIQGAENAEEIQQAIKPVAIAITSAVQAGTITEEQAAQEVEALYQYGGFMAQNKALLFGQKTQDRQLADARRAQLTERYGRFWQEESEGMQNVQMASLNNGSNVFVVSAPNEQGAIATIDMTTGRRGFANVTDIATNEVDGEMIPSTATMTMDAFLDNEIALDRKTAEEVRMTNERNAQIDALRAQIVPGTRINLGTEGSPVIVYAKGTSRSGVAIIDETGMESLLGWNQAADALGQPIIVKTDKQITDEEIAARAQRMAERRRKVAATPSMLDDTVTAAAEETAEKAVEEQRHIPMNEDGTVNETAFWEQDPEGYVAWNDEQNQDGGADSLEQIAISKNELTALLSQAQEAQNTSNPSQRKAAKAEAARISEKIARLEAIEQSYATIGEEMSPAEQKEADRAESLRERARSWERETGVKINIIEDEAELAAIESSAYAQHRSGKQVKGWAKDGQAYIYLPNIQDEADVDETYIHEVVAHLGLRGLLGEDGFNELLDKVWDIMSEEAKRTFIAYPGVNGNQRSAADEYIAHLAERMGSDAITNEVERTTLEKIIDFIKNLLSKIGVRFNLAERELADLLAQSYANLRQNAAEKPVQTAEEPTESEEQPEAAVSEVETSASALESRGLGVDTQNDDVRYSIRYTPTDAQREAIIDGIVAVTGRDRATAERWLASETSLAAMVGDNMQHLDYQVDSKYKAIKDNSDYPQGTVDFNNICRKRLPFTKMFTRLQKRYPNRVFTADELADIRNIMSGDGLTVACGLCYVEDRRQMVGEVADQFITELQNGFSNYASGNATKRRNADKFLALVGEDDYIPSIYELTTQEGGDKLYNEHRGVWEAFQAFNNARGQQSQNLLQGYAEYKREILSWSDKKVKSVNDNGGLRIFSYSDFEAHHLLDIIQIIIDCASKGVKIQGYTKVPAFARAVANTGIKLNRSLIPLGDTGIKDGQLAFDPVEGIDINDPDFLESNDNVGNTLIGINDVQIRMAMVDPRIHYIIPYHARQKKNIRKKLNVGEWVNYISTQNERNLSDGKSVKDNINIYTDVLGEDVTNDRQFVEKYLQLCMEMGRIPKFDQFLNRDAEGNYAYTPGYYKFLVDFKLFDENGDILPQKPVVAEFDDAFNMQILEDYVKGEQEATGDQMNETYDKIVETLGLDESPAKGEDIRFSVKEENPYDLIEAAREAAARQGDVRFRVMSDEDYAMAQRIISNLAGDTYFRRLGGEYELGKLASNYAELADIIMAIDANRDYTPVGTALLGFFAENPDMHFPLLFNDSKLGKETAKAFAEELSKVDDPFALYFIKDAWRIHKGSLEQAGLGVKPSSTTKFNKAIDARAEEIRAAEVKGTAFNFKKQESSLDEIDAIFKRLNKDEDLAILHDRVMNVARTLGVKVSFAGKRGNTAGESLGDKVSYDYKYFNTPAVADQKKCQTIVHELIHSITTYAIYLEAKAPSMLTDGMLEAVGILRDIYNQIARDPAFEGEYGVTDVYEMVAELSNAQFRDKLKEKSLFQRILDALKRLLGIDTVKEDSAYQVLSDTLDYIIDNYDQAAFDAYALYASKNRSYGRMMKIEEAPRFRITPEQDKAYMDAVEAGDMETAQRMVVEAAKLAMPNTKVVDKKGNPTVVYHGTKGKFNIFAYSREDIGFHFGTKGTARTRIGRGKDTRIMQVFLNLENPLIFDTDLGSWDADYIIKDLLKKEMMSYDDAKAILLTPNGYKRNSVSALVELRQWMSNNGYDGIIYPNWYESNGKDSYIAFSRSQIKSADPVTYDNDGNVIPLSERFNEENPDIRFRVRSEEEREKLFEDTKAHYGVTQNFNAAGYMLPDGSLLDFSEANDGGDPNSRSLDHRDIEGVIMDNGAEYDSRWMYIADFMNEGAIRLLPESAGINMIQAPTEEQRKKIFDFIYKYNGEVILEINDERLNSIVYMEYDRKTSPARIFRDIDGYFKDGIVPQQDIRFRMSNENQAIFVSNAAKAVEAIKQEKATPEQWLKMIEKNGGLKAGEDKWMGLSDWLKASDKKTLTKQEVLDFINENMIVIEEERYGEVELSALQDEFNEIYDSIIDNVGNEDESNLQLWEVVMNPMERAWEELRDRYSGGDDFDMAFSYDRHGNIEINDLDAAGYFLGVKPINDIRLDYTTSGLQNKQEIALVVPNIEPWNERDEVHFGDAGDGRAIAWIRFGETWERKPSPQISRKVLVIDEIQSNRHQEGRDRGYFDIRDRKAVNATRDAVEQAAKARDDYKRMLDEKYGVPTTLKSKTASKEEIAELKRLRAEVEKARAAMFEVQEKANMSGIPDAPFDKNWHELAMKRMLRYAAENGFDVIAWTTGDQQNQRYGLSKVVDEIYVASDFASTKNEESSFRMILKNGNDNHVGVNKKTGIVTFYNEIPQAIGKPLSDLLGKELADKILAARDYQTFRGVDFELSEGMKGFYDKRLPAFMNKYGKKWGVKVEYIDLPNLGKEGLTMHSVPVTEEMKASVMEGQVMFRVRGEDESATDFHKSVLDHYMTEHKVIVPTTAVDVNDRKAVAEALGYAEEEFSDEMYQQIVDGVNDGGEALYDEDKKRIAIFAVEDALRSADVEENIFHENVHALIAKHPELLDLGQWMWDNANGGVLKKCKDEVLSQNYAESKQSNEMLSRFTGVILAAGRAGDVARMLPEDQKKHWELLLNELGYEPERNDGDRRLRFKSDSRRAGVLRDEAQQEVSDNGASERAGLSAEERRIINELFPGTFESPIERARQDVNENPTEAQKKAGNYRMGHLRLDGYNITIENPKGSVRRGTDSKGNAWENTLNNDYGYIRGTESVDGDHIDIYLSDNPEEGNVFVIDQVNPETREFDEHKVMYGFSSEEEARAAYLANYSEGWSGLGTITEVSKDEFKKWIDSSHRKTKPFSEYKSVRTDESQAPDESGLRYRIVTNQETLDILNSEPTIKVYRAMQLIDGKLYPPMSAKVDGEFRQPIELGQWEEAEERPDLADNKGYFKLDKGNKKNLKARYNPYFHTSYTPLNDQFSEAQDRPNLVTVEVEIPESELTSGYKADKAKDSVGEKEWKAGVIQGKLSGTRKVILSRWDKPVRIVPDSEVADVIVKMFEGRDIVMPSNVVTPSLRAELEKRGVPFVETDNKGKPISEFGPIYEQFRGKPKEAVEFLMEKKTGEAVGALNHKDIGDISMVYGNEKAGLKKIAVKHQEVLDILQDILDEATIVQQSENRIKLESGRYFAVISKDYHGKPRAPWLLTSFEKKNSVPDNTMDTGETSKGSKQNDTATLQDTVSDSKDTDNLENINDSEENISYRIIGTPTDKVVADGLELTTAQTAELAGNIFSALPEDTRRQITEDLPNILDLQDAIMQIPARLAMKEEWNDEDKAVAEVVREKIQDIVDSREGQTSRPLTAKEALWLLHHYDETDSDLIAAAKDAIVARNLGFDPSSNARRTEEADYIRFRTASNSAIDAATDMYNYETSLWTERLKESWLDMNQSVISLQNAMATVSGMPIEPWENIEFALNRLSSKSYADKKKYLRDFLMPMWDMILDIVKHDHVSIEEIERYMMLKHGLERNKKFASRDAREFYRTMYEVVAERMKNQSHAQQVVALSEAKKKLADIDAQIAVASSSQLPRLNEARAKAQHDVNVADLVLRGDEKQNEAELQAYYDAIDNEVDPKYREFREKDYGGLTSMFVDTTDVKRSDYKSEEAYQQAVLAAHSPKFDKVADMEAEAEREVEAFEGKVYMYSSLWDKVNSATKETLRHQYESGMIAREQYEAVRDMFEFYVPLRGFADNTAEDMYSYYMNNSSNGFAMPILGAKGRKTRAESPLGWIGTMAESAIQADNKNKAKMCLYYMTLRRPDQNLLTVTETWYEYTGQKDANGKKIFKAAYPPAVDHALTADELRQHIEDWDDDMKKKQSRGEAYKGSQKVDLKGSVVFQDIKEEKEHIVRVKVAGKDYSILINGNPRAAQAINGLLNPDANVGPVAQWIGDARRNLSALLTSYSPLFWVANYQRDLLSSVMRVSEAEGWDTAMKYLVNRRKAWRVVSYINKYDEGALGDSYYEKLYKEFAENGGITGYTSLTTNKEYENLLEKYANNVDKHVLNAVKGVWEKFMGFGEAIEQVSRFAAFITAREEGKSIEEAVNAAKEVSVNFNRKGSAKPISLDELDKLRTKDGKKLNQAQRVAALVLSAMPGPMKYCYYFVNASIQALSSSAKLAKKSPGKAATWVGMYMGASIALAMLNYLLSDDDDDEYLNLPDYLRHSTILVKVADGYYFKWSIPQEMRPFYALADIFIRKMTGKMPHKSGKDVGKEAALAASQWLPVNPFEAEDPLLSLVPDFLSPLAEIKANTNAFGGKIYDDMPYKSEGVVKEMPAYRKATEKTGAVYVDMAEFLNDVTGGDEVTKGIININPAIMEHLVEGYGGGIYDFAKMMVSIPSMILSDDPVQIKEIPFVNKVILSVDETNMYSHTNEAFYHYRNVADNAKRVEKEYRESDNPSRADAYREEEDWRIYLLYKQYESDFKDVKERLDNAVDKSEEDLLKQEQNILREMFLNDIAAGNLPETTFQIREDMKRIEKDLKKIMQPVTDANKERLDRKKAGDVDGMLEAIERRDSLKGTPEYIKAEAANATLKKMKKQISSLGSVTRGSQRDSVIGELERNYERLLHQISDL